MPRNSGDPDGSAARHPSVVPDAHGATGMLLASWWVRRACFARLEEEEDDALAALWGLATVAQRMGRVLGQRGPGSNAAAQTRK